MIKVMIVDDNTELVDELSTYIMGEPDMRVVGKAYNGNDALYQLQNLSQAPDVLLLDLIMPYLDGLGVLETLSRWNWFSNLKVIVISAFAQEHLVVKSAAFGVSYCMLKPIDVELLGIRIRQLCDADASQRFKKKDKTRNEAPSILQSLPLENQIAALLNSFTILPKWKGYFYLQEAILLVYHRQHTVTSFSRHIYPTIAQKYDVTPAQVSRAIRRAVQSSWTKHSPERFNELLGYKYLAVTSKPTNSLFISTLANSLQILRSNRAEESHQRIT
ncbi:sporulation transcription factor Spo0A [Paenibacillus sp. WLX1005]|uniref:sporulation transcription factor Spo0A n=1 Tax=Paenibacillus sp. WLX1005 TaxID=3243766 RepID=UPI0039843E26